MPIRIHSTAEVSPEAIVGEGTTIWHHAQVRENVRLGRNCVIGKGVYLDFGVCLGDNVKIQNYVSAYHGVTIEDGVFVGPHVCFTNDRCPRAVNLNGSPKGDDSWVLGQTLVQEGATIGANATIVCGTTIGRWAMVGSGSVVTRDVPGHGLVYGNPARLHGFVCLCGEKMMSHESGESDGVGMVCPECRAEILIPLADYARLVRE